MNENQINLRKNGFQFLCIRTKLYDIFLLERIGGITHGGPR